MIDASRLVACGVQAREAMVFAPHLQATFDRFAIETPRQLAAFIAQAMHESGGFRKLTELTYYSRPELIHSAFKRLRHIPLEVLAKNYCKKPVALANLAYANINGNGDEASGDGWLFRGGGIFQNTGRDAYRHAGKMLGVDFENKPELLRTNPDCACLAAGLFWDENDFNELAEAGEFDLVSNILNTGRKDRVANGTEDRRKLYVRALPVFSNP